MEATLSIVIFRGDPVDIQSTRHTALFIEMKDGSNVMVHIVGTVGLFSKEVKENVEPTKSQKFLKKIPVAKISGKSRQEIRSQLNSTVIKSSRDWNCQNWVGDALKGISDKAWITPMVRSSAIDRMLDVVMEAPDE